jgi:hypothetical protein
MEALRSSKHALYLALFTTSSLTISMKTGQRQGQGPRLQKGELRAPCWTHTAANLNISTLHIYVCNKELSVDSGLQFNQSSIHRYIDNS